MRILICGGREFSNQEKFDRAMEPFAMITTRGPIRNEQMLREGKPDWVIAFESGTRNMVELTRVAIRAGAKITLAEVF